MGFKGREGTNNVWEIIDPNARIFRDTLRIWAKATSALYDKVIDPISAPKNIPVEGHRKFHELCQEMRQMDMAVAESLLTLTNYGNKERSVQAADRAVSQNEHCLNLITTTADQLYRTYSLGYNASVNQRL